MTAGIQGHIILFDGVCNLCNSLVRFIIKRDRKRIMKFAPLQSVTGRDLIEAAGLNPDRIKTIVYISDGKYYFKSSAILNILKDIGGGWKLFYTFIIVPRFLRNPMYDLVAATRYRVFGRRETCMVPDDRIKSRFLS